MEKYVKDGAVARDAEVYVQSMWLDDDILFPILRPKVEIGKFKNTIAEVNEEYLRKQLFLLGGAENDA